MATPRQTPSKPDEEPAVARISAVESACYTADLLGNLQKMALTQGQSILAHLLELARAEARMVVRDQTIPPGLGG